MNQAQRGWRPPEPPRIQRTQKSNQGIVWGVVLILMVAWTALCGFGYLIADPLLAWLGAVTNTVVENGQGLAETFGGKLAGDAVKALDSSSLLDQLLAAAVLIVKPAIIFIWILGLVALLLLPKIARVAGNLLRRRM